MPEVDAILMMLPPPPAIMCDRAYLQQWNAPVTFTANVASHQASSSSATLSVTAWSGRFFAALFTRPASRPSASSAALLSPFLAGFAPEDGDPPVRVHSRCHEPANLLHRCDVAFNDEPASPRLLDESQRLPQALRT